MIIREQLYIIVFKTDTKAGKQFDVVLLCIILFSVMVVMLESVPELGLKYHRAFITIEWSLTIIFSIEYFLRIAISPKPLKYIFSFGGFIDLFSIFPTYLSFFISGCHYLLIVRIFRLFRVFRILKLVRFISEAQILIKSLKSSMYKISIFLLSVLVIVTFPGTLMYVVENGKEGFTSIPQSIYWAIATVTTVGYGDMVPHTVLGKFISSFAMIIGYAIIAVPTGIVTVEMARASNKTRLCSTCDQKNDLAASYCNNCGNSLNT